MKYKTVEQIGEYYNTAHLLRPVKADLVNEYEDFMRQGVDFPPIKLGEYPSIDGGNGKIIIDGTHRYKAAVAAKLPRHAIEVQEYKTLADALADQLKANLSHGERVDVSDRDARIRMLKDVFKWPVRKIAHSVGLHFSSVSRIARHKQNRSGTGKPGRKADSPDPNMDGAISALAPKPFFRTVEKIHSTLTEDNSRNSVVALLQDPNQKDDKDRLLVLLQQVASEVQFLLRLATEPVSVDKKKRAA